MGAFRPAVDCPARQPQKVIRAVLEPAAKERPSALRSDRVAKERRELNPQSRPGEQVSDSECGCHLGGVSGHSGWSLPRAFRSPRGGSAGSVECWRPADSAGRIIGSEQSLAPAERTDAAIKLVARRPARPRPPWGPDRHPGDLRLRSDLLFLGEQALDGTPRHTHGILPMLALAREKGLRQVFVPAVDAAEASLIV